jgi:hypothetical protein
MPYRSQLARVITTTVALLGLVSGCGWFGNGKTGERAGGAALPGPDTAPSDFALPINSYSPSIEDVAVLTKARKLLIGECMQRSGFHFDSVAALAPLDRAASNDMSDNGLYGNKRRYGITDMETATRYGYHLVSVATGTALPARQGGASNSYGVGEITEAKRVALDRCIGEAQKRLIGINTDLIARIASESYSGSFKDPAVTSAFAAWSVCMRTNGYDKTTPREASGFDIDVPTVSAEEVTAAQVDVRCKEQSNLVRIWYGFEVAYQNAQIEQHLPALQRIRNEKDRTLTLASDIVTRGS